MTEQSDRLASLARDACYVAVGLGVLAFQQAQVRRRQLQQQLSARLDDLARRRPSPPGG